MIDSVVAAAAPATARNSYDKPVLEVEGGPGGMTRDSVRELWHFREVLYAFVLRQVKVKYKQAAVGIGWAIVQPVAAALLFALFFGRLVHLYSEGAPYVVFALAGMVAWGFFSGAVSGAMESIVSDSMMLRKVYFPREIFPVAAVGAAIFDLVPALATLLVGAVAFGLAPTVAWLALPVPLLLLVVPALALGLALSALNVYYRDVRYVLPFILQLALFATPVVYSLSVVPGRWRPVYEILNPVAAAIEGLRRIVLHGEWPEFGVTTAAFAWSALLLLGAYVLFKRLERGFSDRV
jgi:lipopolysaccharide transport system permease protein